MSSIALSQTRAVLNEEQRLPLYDEMVEGDIVFEIETQKFFVLCGRPGWVPSAWLEFSAEQSFKICGWCGVLRGAGTSGGSCMRHGDGERFLGKCEWKCA